MSKTSQRFHLRRGFPILAVALALIVGTAPSAWAQKSESSPKTPRTVSRHPSSSPRGSVRQAPRASRPSSPRVSSPRSGSSRRAPSVPRSGTRSGPSSTGRKGIELPRSGITGGPTQYRKGTELPRSGITRGPTPGPRYTPRAPGHDSGSHHHGSGHYGGHYGGSYGRGHYGGHFSFGLGFGFFPYYYGYPYYYGSYYYRPYLGYGYYPYSYPYYPRRGRVVGVEAQGGVDLNVKPKDTQVYLNGYYVGTTGDFDGWPRYLWLDEDTYELIFYNEGYETVVRELAIQPDVVINLKFRMQPGPSTPPEELTRYRGEEPRRERSYRDEREYRYRDRGYDERGYGEPGYGERRPEAAPRERSAAPRPEALDLRTDAGRLYLDISPPEASVYIDGRFVGIGGELSRLEVGLLMDAGEHSIQVFHPEHETKEKTFTITVGKETRLGIDLRSR